MSKKNKGGNLYFLVILLFPFLMFGPALAQGKVLYWGTPSLQFIPWRGAAMEMMLNGTFPLWNPNNGMGAPLLANYQLAAFYPPGWALFLFFVAGGYPWLAWGFTFLVPLHLAFMGAGIFLLMRELNYQKTTSLISALVFSLSSFFVSRAGFFSIIWTAAWLPWIVLYASRMTFLGSKNISIRNFPVKLTFCTCMMLLAGHAQISWYILTLTFLWVIFWAFQSRAGNKLPIILLTLAIACVAAAALSAVQLLPTFEYLLQSQRSGSVEMDQALTYSLWPWRFITFLAPDFYGNPGRGDYWGYANYWEDSIYFGALAFLLAIFSLTIFRRNNQPSNFNEKQFCRFLWGMILLSIILALGKFTPVFPFLFKNIPTFDMFNSPTRFFIIADFCFAILAGIGFERLAKPTGKTLYWLHLFTAGGFAVVVGTILTYVLLPTTRSTFITASIKAGITLLVFGILWLMMPGTQNHKNNACWKAIFIGCVAGEILLNLQGVNPLISMNFYDSEISQNSMVSEMAGNGRLFLDPEDEYLIKFKRFLRFDDFRPIEADENLYHVIVPNINLMQDISSANNFDPMVPERFSRWLDMFRQLSKDEKISWLKRMNVHVYETYSPEESLGVKFMPITGASRFRWSSCPLFAENEEDALNKMVNLAAKNGAASKRSVIEATPKEVSLFKCSEEGPVVLKILRDSPLITEIGIEAEHSGWIIMADTWYPGWKAFLDGKPEKIYHGDYLFRAVAIPKGNHTIIFEYQPTAFRVGLIISVVGFLAMVGIIHSQRKERIIS